MVKGAVQCQLLRWILRNYEQRGLVARLHLARYRPLEALIVKSISSPTASSSIDSPAATFGFKKDAFTRACDPGGGHREELRFLDEQFWVAPRLAILLMG